MRTNLKIQDIAMSTQNLDSDGPRTQPFDAGLPVHSSSGTRPVRAVSTNDLFRRGEYEIAIHHGDSVYSLKITRQDRLVLNK